MTIRAIIADDEPLARRGIRQLLAPHPDVTVIAEARNWRDAVRAVRSHKPDLLFLDVQMPELDGFEVLRELKGEHPACVIFVTAYDEFAVRAFDAHALDYLVKPLQEARFTEALDRTRERLRSDHAVELSCRLSALLASHEQVRPDALRATRIVAPTANGDVVLDVDEITWIEAEDYYAAIHAHGRRYLIRESLASLESRLDGAKFLRAHRSALVNIDHVRELRNEVSGETILVLRNRERVPVSRRRREQVSTRLRRL